YFEAACLTAVVYDWALTFGQEFELVWRQRWSLMTFLYLSVCSFKFWLQVQFKAGAIHWNTIHCRHAADLPSILLTDAGCTILYFVDNWIGVIVDFMLGVIIIARLYAMYQRSRQILIFLVVTFLAIRLTSVVLSAIANRYTSGDEYVLSGVHVCDYVFQGDVILPVEITWILATVWETLAFPLAVWVAIKHFRELQRPSSGWTVGDCFTILIKTHVFYFASSPKLRNSTSVTWSIFTGILEFTRGVQMFILGPRLILAVREYHANLVANSDEGTGMASIVFQERVHISTGSGV
ncbi:hypothetical protein K503DRAFT_788126, partial [Rhizopogon vinicolor AM-OR11-026]